MSYQYIQICLIFNNDCAEFPRIPVLFNTLFNGLNLKGEKENVLGAEKAGSEVHAVSLVEVPEVDAEDGPDAAGAAPEASACAGDTEAAALRAEGTKAALGSGPEMPPEGHSAASDEAVARSHDKGTAEGESFGGNAELEEESPPVESEACAGDDLQEEARAGAAAAPAQG